MPVRSALGHTFALGLNKVEEPLRGCIAEEDQGRAGNAFGAWESKGRESESSLSVANEGQRSPVTLRCLRDLFKAVDCDDFPA